MHNTRLIMPILTVILWLSFAPARADYHYASHEGSDEYPYLSWETAADSIQNAIDASSPHDTVYIGAGEWYETVATGVYDSVAIIGMGTDSTFLFTSEYHVPVLTIDYNCSVEGITFHHLDNWKCLLARAYAGVRIDRCQFRKSRIGIDAAGGPSSISNCVFDSCSKAIQLPVWIGDFHIFNNLILDSYEYAMYLQVESAVVENNIIINLPGSVSSAINGAPTGPVHIRNNVAVNGAWGMGAGMNAFRDDRHNNIAKDINRTYDSYGIGATNDSLYNNLTINCYYGIATASNENVINYNAFWRNVNDFDHYGEFDSVGNIFVNPMLVNNQDFHLQAFSPLIDAGNPEVFDIDGSRSDIGVYGGPYGCSYVYLDLAPLIPDSISVEIDSEAVTLRWRFNSEADFNRYEVFRDTVSGFEPSQFNMIAEPETSYFEDSGIEPGMSYYYRLTSVDNQGNVSEYSDEVAVIPTGVISSPDGILPRYTVIESAYPNPFNSNVTIVYSASNLGPQPPKVTLKIYDIQGRLVKTLVDGRKPMGTYRAIWDGTDDHGWPVSSGVYVAKVYQWGMDAGDFPVKITLLR